jgi:hypothetical protein
VNSTGSDLTWTDTNTSSSLGFYTLNLECIIINADYDENTPGSYRGVVIEFPHEDERITVKSNYPLNDVETAIQIAELYKESYSISIASSVDNLKSDMQRFFIKG